MQSIKKIMLIKACLKSLEVLTSMVTPQVLLAEITAQCICSMSLFSLNNDFLWKSFINLLKLGPYAALRAADLDWIVGPGYSLGRVH